MYSFISKKNKKKNSKAEKFNNRLNSTDAKKVLAFEGDIISMLCTWWIAAEFFKEIARGHKEVETSGVRVELSQADRFLYATTIGNVIVNCYCYWLQHPIAKGLV